MCIFGQKHDNSVKTIIYYWPKKSKGCSLFATFYEKHFTLMRIFVKKRTFSMENTLLMPIFCQKNVHSLKNTVLPCQFFH